MLGNMGDTSSTGTISVIHNLCYKNLGYTIYTTILKNHMKTTLDAIIGKNQSAAIKSRTILHTFASIRDVIYVSHNLNSSLA